MRETNQSFDPLEALTVREAAALLHCSEPTIRKYIKAGELPSITIGRCRRIRRADLEAFLQGRTAYGWERRPQGTTPVPEMSPSVPEDIYDIPF